MMTPQSHEGNDLVPPWMNRRDGHPIDAGRDGRAIGCNGRPGLGQAPSPRSPTPAGPRPRPIA